MKSDKIYFIHIPKSIDSILSYTRDISEEAFYSNQLVIDAVIRNFEIIGEATKHVSSVSRTRYPKLPWRQMAGMRDKLIHDYEGVNLQQIWDTIREVLPVLRQELQEMIKEN